MSETRLTASEESILWSAAIDQGTMPALARACERILDARLADRDAAGVEARVRALADEWDATVYKLPPGYPMTVNEFCGIWFKRALRVALSGPADAHPADGTGT